MTHRRRGQAIIFNHMKFDSALQLSPRNGTDVDRLSLQEFFFQQNFEVKVFQDLSYLEIHDVLVSVSLEDHSDADCLWVTVLSHGELGSLYARDSPYKPDRLWSHFIGDECKSLAGKPKIFTIQ